MVGAAGAQPLKLDKSPSAFVLSGPIGAGDSIVAEQARVTERKQADKAIRTLGRLAARYVPDFAERTPVLTLDIVPTGKPGAFRVVYDGKPLAKAKLELIAEFGLEARVSHRRAGRGRCQPAVARRLCDRGRASRCRRRRRGRRCLRPQALRDRAVVPRHRRRRRPAGPAAHRAEARCDGGVTFLVETSFYSPFAASRGREPDRLGS